MLYSTGRIYTLKSMDPVELQRTVTELISRLSELAEKPYTLEVIWPSPDRCRLICDDQVGRYVYQYLQSHGDPAPFGNI